MKYNVGEHIGVNNILFVERCSDTDKRGRHPYGIFQCPECGENFKSAIRCITQGDTKRCKKCSAQYKSQRMKNNSYGSKNSKNLVGLKFGEWTVISKTDERQNGHVLWECQCSCGKIYKVITPNLTQKISTRCIECSKQNSRGNKRISEILKNLNISFETEKAFEGCKKKNKLRFDFYLPDYNTCIEYDGEQHFQEVEIFRNKLQDNINRDNIKNQYCEDNGIKLIRIPYWDYKKINENYLLEKLGGDLGDESFNRRN